MAKHDLAIWVGRFFQDYLMHQRRVSRHTVHSYRDSWKLLLHYTCMCAKRHVDKLSVDDIGPEVITGFLEHLSNQRFNQASSRNIRLAAIRAFFRWLATVEPQYLMICKQVVDIPSAAEKEATVPYLEKGEYEAILSAIDCDRPKGVRDYALLALLYNTGARVQEVLDLRVRDLQLERPYLVKLLGKGNKERICTLWPETVEWVCELLRVRQIRLGSDEHLFVNRYGGRLTRHGVRYLLRRAGERASEQQESLRTKRLHPHVIRHTTGMHMLQSGVDLATIQNILGHASMSTTERYARADLEMKRAALEKCRPLTSKREVPLWKTETGIMDFLKSL